MSKLLLQLRAVSSELRRRKVVQVVIAYLVASAAIIGVVSDIEPALDLPEHTLTLVVVLLVAGLPLVGLLAWMYDVVPDPGRRRGGAAPGPAGDGGAVEGREESGSGQPDALPTPGTPFIGRDAELAELTQLLADPDRRLVTVLGPGGVGKTRLALSAAERVAPRFPDGVVFVPLAGLPGPELLPQAIAEALNITPSRRNELQAELLDFLRCKKQLLVLDNFEQLAAAAQTVDAVLQAAPGVHILTTSRERLNLGAESLLPLAGLTLEHTADRPESDAVRLFVAAARRQDARFELDEATRRCAERLCALLAGLPLAIELAAAWTRILTCGEILHEVRRDLDILTSEVAGAPERQRSLGATFDASWRLLGERERAALARLSVFMAPFDRDAAAAVAGADLPLLRMLVDKSFLTPVHGRFQMLHVVRQYALKRLERDAADEQATRGRHVAWVARWLHSLEPQLLRSEPEAATSVAQSIAEVRAAWSYACDSRDLQALLLAMDGLFHFYEARGWSREGAEAFGRAATALRDVARADDPAVISARGRLAVRRGALLERLGELKEAERLLREGLRNAEQLGDTPEVAFALHRLGKVCSTAGAYDDAAEYHDRARALYEQLGDRHAMGWSLAYLGNVALNRGEHDLAAQLYTDSLRILRAEHDRNGMCAVLNNLGYIAIRRKQYDQARHNMGEALSLQAVLGNHRSAAYLLNNLGYAAREAGDYAEAVQHFEEARAISERLGYRGIAAASLTAMAELYVRTGKLAEAEQLLRRSLGIAAEIGDHRVALEALLTFARLRERSGETAAGLRLARFVASNPATPADSAEEAAELLRRHPLIDAVPAVSHHDVGDMVAEILSRSEVQTAAPEAADFVPAARDRTGTSIQRR
jgi:predicted ATPase/Tfp pilus assembly protein PilF